MLHASDAFAPTIEHQFVPVFPTLKAQALKRLHILLVEDMNADAMLTKIALDATKIPFMLSKIKRGDEALSRLSITQKICPADMPDLILLDLGLPGLDGFEVLAELAQMPVSIRAIPIAVLTAHQHFEYMRHSYPHLHIIGYVNKPCHAEEMKRVLTQALQEKGRVVIA